MPDRIPVLVIPCDKHEGKYDVFKCNKCHITNNNDCDMVSFIKDAKITFGVVDDEISRKLFLDKSLDAYSRTKPYRPLGSYRKPFFRIIFINKHALYNGCLLITFKT